MKSHKPMLSAFGRLATAAALLCVFSLPVAAQRLTGTYDSTGIASCLISPSGFNSDLTPVSDAGVAIKTYVTQGTFTFSANHTGTSQFQDVIITQPGPSSPAGGSSDEGSLTFTYSATTAGTYTLNIETTRATMLTGPDAGATYTIINKPPSTLRVARNGSVVYTTLSPTVEQVLNASGVTVQNRICVRSFVLLPVE